MPRHLNLRQIEAFKAIMENGTVSRAAEVLNVSQPAVSKLIGHLEFDTGVRLFDRVRRRLVPTDHALRLHQEVERIFAGVRQVESVVEAIRREEQGRIAIGVMPALSRSFIQRATSAFRRSHPQVFCSVQAKSSDWIVERVVARKLDVGLVNLRAASPYATLEPLMDHPFVCIMPIGHPLAVKRVIVPQDLEGTPFVTFHSETVSTYGIEEMFRASGVVPQTVLIADVAPMICEFVAEGYGLSLVHPLMMSGLEDKLVVRPFSPDIHYSFQLCHMPDSRNAAIARSFMDAVRSTATEISQFLANAP
jgi:DNA-binding transcriptional LysR family regulator